MSGVPQGSVLGPILCFNIYIYIYIYDLEDDISSKVLKFADDTKVFRKVTDVRGGLGELGHRESWATPNFMEVASCCGQVLPSI